MILGPLSSAAAASTPTIIDLGALDGGTFSGKILVSSATAVSGTIVVGQGVLTSGPYHAFAYDVGAASPAMIDLGTLRGFSFGGGGTVSQAGAVSGDIVAGSSETVNADIDATAWLLTTGGTPLPVGTVGMIGIATLAGCALFITQRRRGNRLTASAG